MGKDVENQLTAIGDRALEQAFQVAGLHRRQFSIGHHQRGPAPPHLESRVVEFAGAPEGLRIGAAGTLADHRHRPSASTAHQALQFRQLPLPAEFVAVREGQQQHRFLVAPPGAGLWIPRTGVTGGEVQLAQVAQIAAVQLPPAFRCLPVGLQQLSLAQAIGARAWGVTQPAAGSKVEGHDCIRTGGGQSLTLKWAAHQPPATAAAARCAG